jgi:thymidine phosphorylase
MLLGAGREKVDDRIDPAVGLVVHRKIGQPISKGEPLATLHYNGASRLEESERLIAGAFRIDQEPPAPLELVHSVLGLEEVSS